MRSLGRRRFRDAERLIRFHEALLFLRAYPHDRAMRDLAQQIIQQEMHTRQAAIAPPENSMPGMPVDF